MATKKNSQETGTASKGEGVKAGKATTGGKAVSNAADPGAQSADRKRNAGAKPDQTFGESILQARRLLREVVIEFKKISWPGRRQVMQETYSVLFLVTIITLMVLGFDWFVGKFIFGPIGEWTRHLGGGIGSG